MCTANLPSLTVQAKIKGGLIVGMHAHVSVRRIVLLSPAAPTKRTLSSRILDERISMKRKVHKELKLTLLTSTIVLQLVAWSVCVRVCVPAHEVRHIVFSLVTWEHCSEQSLFLVWHIVNVQCVNP